MREFEEFWSAHGTDAGTPLLARNHIVASVCPQLFGLEMVKLPLLLSLIGGVARSKPKTLDDPKIYSALELPLLLSLIGGVARSKP